MLVINSTLKVRDGTVIGIFALTMVSVFALPVAASDWRLALDAATVSLSINPQNPNTVFAGGIGRRVYRSYDAGINWDTLVVNFKGGNSWFTNIIVHSRDTNVVLVGGTNFGSLQRSTDGGESWAKVLTPQLPLRLNGESLVADPSDPDVMYVGHLRPAIIYKSRNGGIVWDSIATIHDVANLCTICIRNDSTNVLLAGCTEGKIRKSTDGGHSWRPCRVQLPQGYEGLEIPKIIFSDADPMLGYAVVTYFSRAREPDGGLYQTRDGGESWRQIAHRGISLWSVAAHSEGDRDNIIVGGFSKDRHTPGRGIVYSLGTVDKGWQEESKQLPWNIDADNNVWMLKISPLSAGKRRLYLASPAGLLIRALKPDSRGIGPTRFGVVDTR